MDQDREDKSGFITTEDAVFATEAIGGNAAVLVGKINELAGRLRGTLPPSQASDVGRQLDQLALAVQSAVDDAVARLRAQLMEWGEPEDDVGCRRCGSADFSRQDCEECNAVRSDGLKLARRLAGWAL